MALAGCLGAQTCSSDGTAYSDCQCDAGSGSSQAASASAGQGGNLSSSSSTSGSTGQGGSGGGIPWAPTALPGLSLWLASGEGISIDPQHVGTVSHWQDKSGNGTQTSSVNIQDGFRFEYDPGAVNGHDAIRCPGNGTWLDVPDAAPLRWGSGDFLIAMVLKGDTQETTPTRYWEKDAGQANGISFMLNASSFELDLAQAKVLAPFQSPSLFHIAIMRGQALKLSVDDSDSSGPVAGIDVDNPGAPVHICLAGQSAQQVEVAEVIAAKGTVSDADVTNLRAYLKAKFAL